MRHRLSRWIRPATLYFSDSGNNAVREVFPAGALAFPATQLGTAATPLTVTLSNIGNLPVVIASGASFGLSGNTTDFSLVGGSCLRRPATLTPSGGSLHSEDRIHTDGDGDTQPDRVRHRRRRLLAAVVPDQRNGG